MPVDVASLPAPSRGAPLGYRYGGSDWMYAGFWPRVGAWLIDTIIFVPLVILAVVFPWLWIAVLPLALLYYPVLESSRWQGTLGKHLGGLKVVNTSGQRISFLRACVRYLAKISLSGLLFGIGFWMIGFTSRKRGLHDVVAGTLVMWDS